MMKRFLQWKNTWMNHVWLRSFMVCLCLALAGVSAWGQSTETMEIRTAEDLYTFGKRVYDGEKTLNAILINDIIVTENVLDDEGMLSNPKMNSNWPKYEHSIGSYAGTFDGNNKKISGLYLSGCFVSSLEESGVIKNLGIVDSYARSLHSIAVLCGTNKGTIENCYTDATVDAPNHSGNGRTIATICSKNQGVIKKCYNLGSIIWDESAELGRYVVGGLVATCDLNAEITQCYNAGDMQITAYGGSETSGPLVAFPSFVVGGVVGMMTIPNGIEPDKNFVAISECYNSGNITIQGNSNIINTTSVYIGGVIGSDFGVDMMKNIYYPSNMRGCYNTGKIVVEDMNFNTKQVYFCAVGGVSGDAYCFQGCYNRGDIVYEDTSKEGILGNAFNSVVDPFTGLPLVVEEKNIQLKDVYYKKNEGVDYVGQVFNMEGASKGEAYNTPLPTKEGATEITEEILQSGEMAWNLRKYGYGLSLPNTNKEYPTLCCFDENLPKVYQLKYTHEGKEIIQYYNPEQKTNLPTLEGGLCWLDEDGKEYKSGFAMPAKDLELTAETGYSINQKIEGKGTISIEPDQDLYRAGATIQVTAAPDEGYELKSLVYSYEENGSPVTKDIENGSFTMPAADVTITAQFELIPPVTYTITIDPNIQNGTVVSDKTESEANAIINLIVTPNNGYQLDKLYYIATETTTEVSITGTTFTMPAANVTVYATFTEKEDPTDPEEPVDPPVVDPTNYYNIYNETTYDFIDVSFSRNVVREGGSINVYLEIPEGLDPTAVTLMYKRGMYNNWETLDEGVQPGEYPINNIWSDIYVKAVVDESYIDPNPDENHIYIDLSETNDSIWLYTERKLVEEGKTAVIQAEVAKSCQNKEIHYMYKRTVLGEWKEMPKDYSINQYVVRDITTDIYVKAYFVFDKQDPTTAKNPHHVYADITATCEGLYLDAIRHKVADEGDTKVFLYVKKGFETKDARYLFKRGLKGEWEDLVPGIEQNTFQVTDIEGDIYLKGMDAVYTGTEDIDGMVRVYTKDGSLFVYTAQPEEISVVSMTGVTVKRTRQTGLQSYPLNQGIYVVCVGEQVFKVRVK